MRRNCDNDDKVSNLNSRRKCFIGGAGGLWVAKVTHRKERFACDYLHCIQNGCFFGLPRFHNLFKRIYELTQNHQPAFLLCLEIHFRIPESNFHHLLNYTKVISLRATAI